MEPYEFDASYAAGEVDDIERGCRRLTDQIERAGSEIDGLEDEIATLKARGVELEGEREAANDEA